MRLIGHHDLARAWERTFRRAGLALRMSEGFRPKPRMVFASALSMGVIGADEALDVELAEPRPAEEIAAALAARLPAGLTVKAVETLPENAPKPRIERVTYELPVPVDRQATVAQRLHGNPLAPQGDAGASLCCPQSADAAQPSIPSTDGRDATAFIEQIELADGVLRFSSRVTPEGTTRPRELLAWLGLADLDEQGLYLTRTAVELAT